MTGADIFVALCQWCWPVRLPPKDDARQNGDTRIGDFNWHQQKRAFHSHTPLTAAKYGHQNGDTIFCGGDHQHQLGDRLQGGGHHLHHPHRPCLQGPGLHHHHPGKTENVNQIKLI